MAATCPSLDRRKSGWLSIWSIALVLMSLTLPAVAAEKTQADYFVHSLPGQPEGPLLKMHAGHIEVLPEHNGHLFFWLFHNRHIGDRHRTVIWLNGGPGCSSMDGAMIEVGPYRVREGGKLERNAGSWDEFANLVFVDNPVGTGFSYVNTDSYVHELQEMADQFLVFMEKWFKLFPEFESDDLYFAGESYAGQHIPYIAKTIMDRNVQAAQTGKTVWKLRGLLIGNGWISPADQYQSYLPFAYEEGLLQGGTPEAEQVEAQHNACLKDIAKSSGKEKVDIYSCEAILQKVLQVTKKNDRCINMYDVRLTDDYPSCGMAWPPDLVHVTPYLQRTDVTNAIHINPDKRTGWTECSGSVSSAFRASHSKPAIDLLPGILEAGIPMTLFSGAKDFICNHLGTEDMISRMKWSNGVGMELSPGVIAPKKDWEFEGQPAGIYQEARNLTYVLFYNSSHMVPFDLPRRSRDMLDRFMGVDITSIGGKPGDSRIGGELAGGETSVEGYPNSTAAMEKEQERMREAELKAYYRSGEAALVVVLIAAAAFGWWVWRGRRKERSQGYMSVPLVNGSLGKRRDIEAGDFDESELDDLRTNGRAADRREEAAAEQYDLASDSEDDDHKSPNPEGGKSGN